MSPRPCTGAQGGAVATLALPRQPPLDRHAPLPWNAGLLCSPRVSTEVTSNAWLKLAHLHLSLISWAHFVSSSLVSSFRPFCLGRRPECTCSPASARWQVRRGGILSCDNATTTLTTSVLDACAAMCWMHVCWMHVQPLPSRHVYCMLRARTCLFVNHRGFLTARDRS